MGSISTLICTSELILCFTIFVHSATRHNIHTYPYDHQSSSVLKPHITETVLTLAVVRGHAMDSNLADNWELAVGICTPERHNSCADHKQSYPRSLSAL